MVYLYKNFLVIDRNETNQHAVQIVKSMNAEFTDRNNVWQVKSEQDKIIIVYGVELTHDDKIHIDAKINNNTIPIGALPVGYIKMYCQGSKIKVSEINFKNESEAKRHLNIFKNYLKNSIKNTGLSSQQIDEEKFILYWSDAMYNSDVEKVLKELNFITNIHMQTCNFTSDMIFNTKPIHVFGSIKW